MTGTPVKCDCHEAETLLHVIPEAQTIEVKDRRHGTSHSVTISLPELVTALDPKGTTFTRTND